MENYYDMLAMRTLLKETTDWDHSKIDSWDLNRLTAIFLERQKKMRSFLIDNEFLPKEKVMAYSFKKLSYEYYNYKPLVSDIIVDHYIMTRDRAYATQETVSGYDDVYNYTWEELIEIYPDLVDSSAAELREFLLNHQIRLLDDGFASFKR